MQQPGADVDHLAAAFVVDEPHSEVIECHASNCRWHSFPPTALVRLRCAGPCLTLMQQLDDSSTPEKQGNPPRRTITSGELLGEEKELVILHNSETYRVHLTRNDKLILMK